MKPITRRRFLGGAAVRTEQWRCAEYGENGKNGAMLSDPKADVREIRNLANDPNNATCAGLAILTRECAAGLGKGLVLWGVSTVTHFSVKRPERSVSVEMFFASIHGGRRG